MTPAQLITLRAACFADPNAAVFFTGQGNSAGLEAYLNADASPAYTVWRTSVTRMELQDADTFNWTVVDNLSTGSKFRIWEWMFQETGAIDPSKANIRAGIAACWVGNAALVAVQTAILGACKRPALRVEKVFASGLGSVASPSVMTLQGAISAGDATQLIYKDDGTIWTAQG
jgi:hypothetical protein